MHDHEIPDAAPSTQETAPLGKASGMKRMAASLLLAVGLLTVGGAAIVSAASPDPSATPTPAASSTPSTTTPGTNGTTHQGNCPNM
jgi:hypothetical protein